MRHNIPAPMRAAGVAAIILLVSSLAVLGGLDPARSPGEPAVALAQAANTVSLHVCKQSSGTFAFAPGTTATIVFSGETGSGFTAIPITVPVAAECTPDAFSIQTASFLTGKVVTISETAPADAVLLTCTVTQQGGATIPCTVSGGVATFTTPEQ